MSSAFRYEIEGIEDLVRQLRRSSLSAGRQLSDGLVQASRPLVRRANQMAPDPLIRVEVLERRAGMVSIAVGPPKDKWYWIFFEYGATPHEITPDTADKLVFQGRNGMVYTARVSHPGMAARPFLRPAYDESKTQVLRAMGEYLVDLIDM